MTIIDEAMKTMTEASAEISKLRARVEHLENVLAVIGSHSNKTLLGGSYETLIEVAPSREPTTELAYEIGANRAFAELAALATDALEAP